MTNTGPDPSKLDANHIPGIQKFKDDVLLVLQAVRINIENIQSLNRTFDSLFTPAEKLWIEDAVRELLQVESRGNTFIRRATNIMDSVKDQPNVRNDYGLTVFRYPLCWLDKRMYRCRTSLI